MRLRFILLCSSSLIAVYFGFIHFGVDEAFMVVGHYGYWFILAAFLCLILSGLACLSAVKKSLSISHLLAHARSPNRILPVVLIVAVWGYLLAAQPAEFKLHMDGPVLAATAKQMHTDRTCFYFTGGYEIQNTYYPHSGAVDKRPLSYPFIVSFLHDVTGYRVENSFIANALILGIFLAALYALGSRILPPLGGYLGLALLTTLPLLSVIANSGGFDLLNATMLVLTSLALLRYVETCSLKYQSLVLALVLILAQSRYESAVFVMPVALGILWHWWQAKRVEVSWMLILAPILLIPFALQRVMMGEYSSFWQMQDGRTEPFSLSYLQENLLHASNYFFSTSGYLPNSLLLSVLFVAAISILLVAVILGRWRILYPMSAKQLIAWLVGLFVFGNFALLMVYHWGHLDDLAVTRIIMPFLSLQAVVVLVACRIVIPDRHLIAVQSCLLAMAVAYFAFWVHPAMAQSRFVPLLSSESLSDRLLELSEELNLDPLVGTPLIISEVSIVGVLSNTSSISAATAVRNLDKLELHMYLKTFDPVFVLYLVGEGFVEAGSQSRGRTLLYERIERSFELTVLEERTIPSGQLMRLARVDRVSESALPIEDRLRPDWGELIVDYTERVFDAEARNQEFVETLPR